MLSPLPVMPGMLWPPFTIRDGLFSLRDVASFGIFTYFSYLNFSIFFDIGLFLSVWSVFVHIHAVFCGLV